MLKCATTLFLSLGVTLFAAATTSVEYTLTVTDTATGVAKSYVNELGVSAPAVTDTSAFATCP